MKKKKAVAWLLVLTLFCSMGVHAFAQDSAASYPDIGGHWAQHMIEEFTQRGYLKGYPDGTFGPDYPVTRAEAGAFVSRLGFPEVYPLVAYSDLQEGTWYYDGVQKATRTGFVHGYPDNTYRPDAFISRQEATKLASHVWGEVDMEGFEMKFSDKSEIASWAEPHLRKLVKMGLLDGYPDNTVRPLANLTRAEFVKLFYLILVEPAYANITLRAVDIDNPSNDIVEPKILSREIGSTVEFDAPEVPSRWQLVGDATQTHVIEQGLEVVFTYRYSQPSGGGSGDGGNTPISTYTLSLTASPPEGGTVTGGGSYAAGTQVTVSAAVYSGYQFAGWYEGMNLLSSNSQFTYAMPAQNTTLEASFVPEGTPLYTLSLTAAPPEGGTIIVGSGSYEAETQIYVRADASEGFEFTGWYEGVNLVNSNSQFIYIMPAQNTTLEARFELTDEEACEVPVLIAHSNYDVDQILTITYEEEGDEFEDWRNNVDRIEIRQLLGGEGIGDPQLFTLETIDLPDASVSIDTPGVLTLDPAQIEVLQDAGANYIIVVITEGGCETEVTQYVQAGAVYSLSYLPYRGITIDFSGQIYPGAIADYNETPFETTLIEVFLIDQYGNTCGSGPSYGAIVYAEAAWDDTGDPGDLGWVLSSLDANNPSLPANQAAVQGVLGYAEFNELKRAGAGLNYCYITFKVYKPGQPHDGTGDSVTKNTALFVLPPVN